MAETGNLRLKILGWAGLLLATAVVLGLGAGQVWHAVLRIGWGGLAEVVAWQFVVFAALGAAWWIFCPDASLGLVIWARLVREGGTTCLPFSVVGGLAFGTRALMLGGLGLAQAAASSVADVLTEGMALAPFIVFGLIELLTRRPGSALAWPMALALGVLVGGGGLAWALRARLGRLLRKATGFLLGRWVQDAPQRADEVHRALGELFSRPGRITAAALAHLVCWAGGAGNVWIGYRLLGARLSVVDALAIESIFSGALSLALLVPGAFGVQELSYVGIGRLFGMPAPLSLALSLLRRARDVLMGGPALLAWQAVEARRLGRGRGFRASHRGGR